MKLFRQVFVSLFFGFALQGLGVAQPPVSSVTSFNQVTAENVQSFWDQGTFPTVDDCIRYHVRKHGAGRDVIEYTRAGVRFFQENKARARWGTWNPRWKPSYKLKLRNAGGYFTREGKIITYWDQP